MTPFCVVVMIGMFSSGVLFGVALTNFRVIHERSERIKDRDKRIEDRHRWIADRRLALLAGVDLKQLSQVTGP